MNIILAPYNTKKYIDLKYYDLFKLLYSVVGNKFDFKDFYLLKPSKKKIKLIYSYANLNSTQGTKSTKTTKSTLTNSSNSLSNSIVHSESNGSLDSLDSFEEIIVDIDYDNLYYLLNNLDKFYVQIGNEFTRYSSIASSYNKYKKKLVILWFDDHIPQKMYNDLENDDVISSKNTIHVKSFNMISTEIDDKINDLIFNKNINSDIIFHVCLNLNYIMNDKNLEYFIKIFNLLKSDILVLDIVDYPNKLTIQQIKYLFEMIF